MNIFVPETFDPAPFDPLSQGQFSVKIADNAEEVIEAQQLRYAIFCEDMGACLSDEAHAMKRDADAFDVVCDHLLVRYHETPEATPRIVGTYRLLRDSNMPIIGRFYSESEFDISRIKSYSGKVMELGRSCTHPDFRHKVAMQLLWRGIGEYIMHYDIELMFGCASFAGIEEGMHDAALSYLYHYHLAPEDIRPSTLPQYYVSMNRMPKEQINEKRVFLQLPVLVKGYLRLGGVVGDGAFLDHAFNTTDVLIMVRTHHVAGKYVSKYAPDSVQGGEG